MKNLSTFLFLLFACAWGQAQDVLVVHRKDGTVQRFAHGIYAAETSFWGSEADGLPVEALRPVTNETLPQLGADWQVTDFEKNADDEYSVFIAWDGTAPTALPYRLCIGTKPGITVETADTSFNVSPSDYSTNGPNTAIAIGHGRTRPLSFWYGTLGLNYNSQTAVNADYVLLHGQTYYYRVAASIPILRNDGGHDTLNVYGPEQHFRIPNLMAEAGIVPKALASDGAVLPSAEAWAAFRAAHLPADLGTPSDAALGSLWTEWMQTTEGCAQKLDLTDIPFDDGVLHLVASVPDVFYTWVATHEVVIVSPDGMESPMIQVQGKDSAQCRLTLVTDVQPEWQLLTNSYVQVEPIAYPQMSNSQSCVIIHTEAVIPGIRYRLTLTLAPVGIPVPFLLLTLGEEQNIEAAVAVQEPGTIRNKEFEATADTPAVVTLDDIFGQRGGARLVLKTNARTTALTRGTESNILRIAEVRLTPMPK